MKFDVVKTLRESVNFLREYPVKKSEYPEDYPEALKFDMYPGKDFVIGMCEETIEKATEKLFDPKVEKANKKLLQKHISLFKQLIDERNEKLTNT